MKRRWTEEEAWAWYTDRPWISGFNFIPSGSMTGSLWLFQEYGHKEAFRDAAREIALAAELEFNSIRMVCRSKSTGRKGRFSFGTWMNSWSCWAVMGLR